MKQIIDELRCDACNRKLGKGQPLWDTAWSGVYWCGRPACATKILKRNGERFKLSDQSNYEEATQ